MSSCPCLCGHAYHGRRECLECGCPSAAPDYVAGAELTGAFVGHPDPANYRRLLEASTASVASQLGYVGPSGRGRGAGRLSTCRYCLGQFRATRSHAITCSGSCREALRVARSYPSEVDIPGAWARNDTWSEDRRNATGCGTVTAVEGYGHDRRVWRAAHVDRVAC